MQPSIEPARKLLVVAFAAAALSAAAGALAVGPREVLDVVIPAGEWVAGDLHVHTIYGHDTCVTPAERWNGTTDSQGRARCVNKNGQPESHTWSATPAERITEAKTRGLDFLAITDHNNVVWQGDPEVVSHTGEPILVPGYEKSLKGHAQMLGARSCFTNTGATTATVGCNTGVDTSTAGVQSLAAALRSAGGAFQINHPTDGPWGYGTDVVPDTVEVWNIGAWHYQPPAPAAADNDGNLAFWDRFLSAGYRVGATGGSDSHWRSTGAVQGVGQPTTWVWVTERTREGVLAGLRAGRTYITHQPPAFGSPRLFLEADGDGNGIFEAMVGDQVPSGSKMRVRVQAAPAGSVLRIVTQDSSEEVVLPPAAYVDGYEFSSTGSDCTVRACFVRVELRTSDVHKERVASCNQLVGGGTTYCRNRLVMQALTSPIYLN